jgi:carbon-monoxide dehydrogenase medium subunit
MLEARFASPSSVDEAVAALASGGADAAILAGGTDLLVQTRTGLRNPGLFVDIKRIPELMALEIDSSGLRLGASVPAAQIYENQAVRAMYPGLSEAVDLIGSSQIQGRATVGGNLCNSSPAADTVPSLIALDATCVVVGPQGERQVKAEAFTTGPGQNVLAADEFLMRIDIAAPETGAADAYLRLIPRSEMDIAVVGAAVSLQLAADGACEAARVALGAVAPTALLVPDAAAALVGTQLDDAALARAGEAASAAANPIDDKRGTVDYRRRVASVLTQRAARIAAERARERR